jgi:hypothetical protein
VAVPVDGTGTMSVEAVKTPAGPGIQKPPRRVGKRFRDRSVAAPEEKVKKPAGLKTRPTWWQRDRVGAARRSAMSGLTPGGRCCLSFPMRGLGLRPCISMGTRSKSN